MCSAPKPPAPVAPPEPIPVRDSQIEARSDLASNQRRIAAEGGIESTMLSQGRAASASNESSVTSPVLGG